MRVIFWADWFMDLPPRGQWFLIILKILQLIENMGNDLFAYVGCDTVLVYSPAINKEAENKYIGKQQGIHIVSLDNQYSRIYKLSKHLLKHMLIQMEKNIESQTIFNLQIIYLNKISHQQIQLLSRQITKTNISFPLSQEQQQLIELIFIPNDKFFNFKIKPSPPNFQSLSDTAQINILQQLPEQYLQVDLSNKFKVYKVQQGKKTLLFRSNLDEQFHLQLLQDVLRRQRPDLLLEPINQVIAQVFEKGNIEASDLLVQDIFGKEGCGFIGLPPKMMAASLGKYAIQQKIGSNLWDQLKSVLFAFGINIAKHIKYQIFATNITKVIVVAHQFSNPYFFQLIDGVTVFYGQVWFYSNAMEAKFIRKMQKTYICRKQKRQIPQ